MPEIDSLSRTQLEHALSLLSENDQASIELAVSQLIQKIKKRSAGRAIFGRIQALEVLAALGRFGGLPKFGGGQIAD